MTTTQPQQRRDTAQEALAAMQELLHRVKLHRMTGVAYVRLDVSQGGVTAVRLCTEETFKTTD